MGCRKSGKKILLCIDIFYLDFLYLCTTKPTAFRDICSSDAEIGRAHV